MLGRNHEELKVYIRLYPYDRQLFLPTLCLVRYMDTLKDKVRFQSRTSIEAVAAVW